MEKNVALSDKIQTVKKILNFKEKILGGGVQIRRKKHVYNQIIFYF